MIAEQGAGPLAGLRERKRTETLKRIQDAGMALFIAHGFEATTLDAIAAAAGISRRTFFYYFKSKDDILLSMQGSMGEQIAAAFREEPVDKRPLVALRDAILRLGALYPVEEMRAIDRVMRASEAVAARKQASYALHERTVYAALRERWPAPEREAELRVAAMLAIGAARLSVERLTQEDGRRPFVDVLAETFGALEAVAAPGAASKER